MTKRQNIPESIESERLILRCPKRGDAAEVNAAIRESLDSLSVWMDWAQTIPTVEETEEKQQGSADAWRQGTNFSLNLYEKESGAFVGIVALSPMNRSVPSYEIGYWLRKRYEGLGYMTEAVRAASEFGLRVLVAQRLEICCDPRNERSRRVAERAGFVLEGRLRNEARTPSGGLRDTLVYGLIPESNEQIEP